MEISTDSYLLEREKESISSDLRKSTSDMSRIGS